MINGEKTIVQLIKEKFDSMSKGQKKIANYVLSNYENAAFYTAAKLGKEAGVSESTVVRFATELGFEGYALFQEQMAKLLQNKLKTTNTYQISASDRTSDILFNVLKADSNNLSDTINSNEPKLFELAIDVLSNAENVYIIGLRHCEPMARILSFYLSLFRENVHYISSSSTGEIFEQMVHLNENDALVGICFPDYSARTLKALEYANDQRAKLICLTDNKYSPATMYSSCNLFAESRLIEGFDSMTAPMSLINAIVIAYSAINGGILEKNQEKLSEIWSSYL